MESSAIATTILICSPGLVVMGGSCSEVVGSKLSMVYWMVIFHINLLQKNCIDVCLKRQKII